MKTIIAGSRTITDSAVVKTAVELSGFEITEIVSGCAKGVDTLAILYATENKIPIKRMSADWERFGKSAGYSRNYDMADYAGSLIAIWDGQSKGTGHMIQIAKKRGLKVFVHVV